MEENNKLEKLGSEELIKVIKEVIENSNIPTGNREIKMYIGPKQWKMFDEAVKKWINENK